MNSKLGRMKVILFGAGLAGAALPHIAAALPDIGEAAADARVEDVDGKVLRLSDLQGKTVVVVYEDKDSGAQNKALKADLAKLLKQEAVKSATAVVPVADVSDYNSWPAKGFARDAIRAESKKANTTIWCDWDASFRKALDIKKGTSSVILLDRKGKVRFAAEGALTEAQRTAFASALKAETAKK